MNEFNIGYIKNILDLPMSKETEETEEPKNLGKLEYEPFRLQNVQTYNPVYERFFSMNENNYNKICLNHKFNFVNMNTLYDYATEEYIPNSQIFLKFAPLLDPVRYLTGKYGSSSNEIKTSIELHRLFASRLQ
jgi:hypothetical protein